MPAVPLSDERLGALDELLLAVARLLVHPVELGEERLAVPLDRRARGAEALPELVALGLREARAVLLLRLPAGEERVELGGDLLPLRLRGILRRQRLGLDDERLALHERLGRGGLRLGRLLLGQLADAAAELLEPLAQAGEIADGVGGRDGLGEVGDRLGDVLRGGAAADALLEQADLAGELGELALVVGERLFRRGVGILTDGAFAVRLTHDRRSRRHRRGPMVPVRWSPPNYSPCRSIPAASRRTAPQPIARPPDAVPRVRTPFHR